MKLLAGLSSRSCRRCSRRFTPKPKAHGQRFCSDKCRALHYFKTVYYPRHIQVKKPRWLVRFCAYAPCRIRFSVSGRGKGHQHRRYCSSPCSSAAKNERVRARRKAT